MGDTQVYTALQTPYKLRGSESQCDLRPLRSRGASRPKGMRDADPTAKRHCAAHPL